ncbi:hypothetical protein AB0M44_06515 [Streptosporangium subroseum]|uniref:hypothetical protein n=1 Tax=Streptosporangium subroseum TaxID=106412 RepID=UPI0034224D6D
MTDSLFPALVGEEMSSVIFVRDYVQLDFNGPRLSLFSWPQIAVDSEVRLMGDPGYRDALCSLIGHTVLTVTEGADTGLVIGFGPGSVVINPEPSQLEGPEIALLDGFIDRADWMAWRPGEYPFDGPEWS